MHMGKVGRCCWVSDRPHFGPKRVLVNYITAEYGTLQNISMRNKEKRRLAQFQ